MKQLFFSGPLSENTLIELPKQTSFRLKKVLRARAGAPLSLFNGKDGLFAATVSNDACTTATVGKKLKEQPTTPSRHLYIGTPKREALSSIIRQSTELGVTNIHIIQTEFSQPSIKNIDRYNSIIIESCEQCERITFPDIHIYKNIRDVFLHIDHHLYWANETLRGAWCCAAPRKELPFGFLIGPEGGFSQMERDFLTQHPSVIPIGLGETILRTDTAVVAAFSLLLAQSDMTAAR